MELKLRHALTFKFNVKLKHTSTLDNAFIDMTEISGCIID